MPPPWLFWKGNLLTITENKGSFMELRGTTILAVRHKGHVALIGDGQVQITFDPKISEWDNPSF